MLQASLTPAGSGKATVAAAPLLGSEVCVCVCERERERVCVFPCTHTYAHTQGATFIMCFTAGDLYRGVSFTGMCSLAVGNLANRACSHDTNCPGAGRCIPACVTVEVQRCR